MGLRYTSVWTDRWHGSQTFGHKRCSRIRLLWPGCQAPGIGRRFLPNPLQRTCQWGARASRFKQPLQSTLCCEDQIGAPSACRSFPTGLSALIQPYFQEPFTGEEDAHGRPNTLSSTTSASIFSHQRRQHSMGYGSGSSPNPRGLLCPRLRTSTFGGRDIIHSP